MGFLFQSVANGHYSKLMPFKTKMYLRCDTVICKKYTFGHSDNQMYISRIYLVFLHGSWLTKTLGIFCSEIRFLLLC